jgi:outer membrane protein, heavy metal efflux system
MIRFLSQAVLSFSFLVCSIHSRAQVVSATQCTTPTTGTEIVECIRAQHPVFAAAKNLRTAAPDAIAAGRRWLNPELQTQNVVKRFNNDPRYEFQFALLQPIQTGGKRAANILAGEGNALTHQAESRTEQGQLLSTAAVSLYRYRQLGLEIEAMDEAASTFGKLVRQYAQRPKLTAEQQVSHSIFKLAQGDYELRIVEAKNEAEQIRNYFLSLLNLDIANTKIALPVYQTPEPSELARFNPAATRDLAPQMLLARAELKFAESSVFQARGNAFSDLALGPMLALNRAGDFQESLYGLMINIPIPAWNLNGYDVSAKRKRADLIEEKLKVREKAVELDIERLLLLIQASVDRLKTLPSQTVLNQRHALLETNFFRGVISPAMMIESHRVVVDFLVQRHQTEVFIIRGLWELYILADRLEEKRI